MKQKLIDAGFTAHEAIIIEWQYQYSSGFKAKLMELIALSDTNNRARLALGFHDEVNAFIMFSERPAWWQGVEARYKEKFRKEGAKP